ncbi:beta-lactamase/transpeptidase-like protein [Parathielavia hyrcaniae]|uniref:Beta-lactamase/transpeptidase-like protein n=1 Tax=Parathielavia hyrcaniae TaxID=113614 RepID=A0AAN6PUC4_9PEZI|nr:beta-lactamase/transpeptidase-like protein [Parathielavia hyrcaniae]
MILFSAVILVAALPLTACGSFDCRPPGPIVPRPTNLASNPTFLSAASDLTRVLESAVTGDIEAGWPVENTSFSVGFITRDQEDKKIPAWEFHFLAPNNVRGTKNITRNSQYLVSSITKVVPDYIILSSGVPLDDPVTKYLPSWPLTQLGSNGFSEVYSLKPYFEGLGFPQVHDDDYLPCGVVDLNAPCTTAELLHGISELHPVAKPGCRPVYSNLAFFLFAHPLEVATGKNYTTLLRELVTEPLGISDTKESPGDDSEAVVPPIEISGGVEMDTCSGSGLVSTLSDLTVFFHSILNRSTMPTETANSPYDFAGMPWEIYREYNLTPNHPHKVDMYGKGGGAPGYRSQATVIDDYRVAIVLLTAGSPKAANFIHKAVLKTPIPVVDEIARDQAAAVYPGTYVNPGESESADGIEVTIAQDRDLLFLQRLDRNGRDMLASYRELFAANIGVTIGVLPTVARLYPTGIAASSVLTLEDRDRGNGAVVREEWRIDWEFVENSETALPGTELGRNHCWNWLTGDWVYHASESMDRIIFVKDVLKGEVLGVKIPVLRSGLLERGPVECRRWTHQ